MKMSMTGPGGTFHIRTPDRGKTWLVVRMAGPGPGEPELSVVWTGKDFREARSQHAARVTGLSIKAARRMTN